MLNFKPFGKNLTLFNLILKNLIPISMKT
nr:unnamed protein product [Callosobruchus analis]